MQMVVSFLCCRKGYELFAVKLSFVATRSGLLRWNDHIPHSPDSPELYAFLFLAVLQFSHHLSFAGISVRRMLKLWICHGSNEPLTSIQSNQIALFTVCHLIRATRPAVGTPHWSRHRMLSFWKDAGTIKRQSRWLVSSISTIHWLAISSTSRQRAPDRARVVKRVPMTSSTVTCWTTMASY